MFVPVVTHKIVKGQKALGEVTHALMRKHYPYRPGPNDAHLCPTKSMVETPTMPSKGAHFEPLTCLQRLHTISFMY